MLMYGQQNYRIVVLTKGWVSGSLLSSRALYTMTGRLEKRFCTALCLAGSAAIHNECVTLYDFPTFLNQKMIVNWNKYGN